MGSWLCHARGDRSDAPCAAVRFRTSDLPFEMSRWTSNGARSTRNIHQRQDLHITYLLRNIHSTTAVKAPLWLSWRRPQRRLASSGRAHAAYARSRRSNASSLAGNPTPVYGFTLQIGDARSAPRLALQYPHPCYFTVLGPRDPEGASTEWVQITAPAFPCRPHLPSPCSQATPPASGQTRWRCLGPAK